MTNKDYQGSRPPNLWQEQAFDIARRSHDLHSRAGIGTHEYQPFTLSMFKPTEPLFKPVEEEARGGFGFEEPVPRWIWGKVDGEWICAIENIAVRLALNPFDFHYGTEDEL